MQKEMSGDEFEQLERTFLRGSLERELADRVKAMNPTLKLGDFRFLYLHLGKDAPAGKEPIELEAAQEAAEFEQEKAAACASSLLIACTHSLLAAVHCCVSCQVACAVSCFYLVFCHARVAGILAPVQGKVGQGCLSVDQVLHFAGRLHFYAEGRQG